MNTKTIVAGVLTGVVVFILGFVIFMQLLGTYYDQNTMHYPGFAKTNPDYLFLAITCLAYGLLLAYTFGLGNIADAKKGFMVGLIVGLLVQINFDAYMYSSFNLWGRKLMAIDVVLNGLMSGVAGTFLGWWLGRKPKA
jgi:hypothetical protein